MNVDDQNVWKFQSKMFTNLESGQQIMGFMRCFFENTILLLQL